MPDDAPTCVELCAGCGGMAYGLARAGYAHRLLVERDARCVDTLHANGFRNVLHADVADVDFAPFRGAVDLVAGGVPCQPFSAAGLGRGVDDERNLFDHAIRCVRECAPRHGFLFENVPGLLKSQHADYVARVLAELRALGYEVRCCLARADDYGLAQARRRCVIVGVPRDRAHAFVAPTPVAARPTVRDMMRALGPPRPALPGRKEEEAETAREAKKGARDAAPPTRHRVHHRTPRQYRNHAPSRMDRPSKTLLAGANGPGGGSNCVELDDGSLRYFTVREMCRLQGFPDAFQPHAVWTRAVHQLGNAAPPPLVAAWAEAIRRAAE